MTAATTLKEVQHLLIVALGGAAGSVLRYVLSVRLTHWLGAGFPWATFLINVTGSFAIGILTVAGTHWFPDPRYRLLVIVGFLGGYTTFSSYSLDAFHLWERAHYLRAVLYLALSVAVGFGATAAGVASGFALIRAMTTTRTGP